MEKKIPPPLVEQSAMVSGKIHQEWRKNPPCLAEILATAENYKLCSVRIFLENSAAENSAAGRLWSCGTPSLARNYLKSFLQCVRTCEAGLSNVFNDFILEFLRAFKFFKQPALSLYLFTVLLGCDKCCHLQSSR
jgi:hypothetical protein